MTITKSSVKIVQCSPQNQQYLGKIWAAWLKDVSGRDPEAEDIIAVNDPEAFYVAKGGMVYFAEIEGEIMGCVALKKLSDDVYELCKLVVTEKARGYGVGRLLSEACTAFVKEKQGRQVALQTFRLSAIAIEMYKIMGFKEIETPNVMSRLQRTEIVMGLDLT